MKQFAIDWNATKNAIVEDGKISNHRFDGSLVSALVNVLAPAAPCVCAIESTFESYDIEQYNQILEQAEQLGVDFVTVSPRATANYRRDNNIPKSDNNDALVIYALAYESDYEVKIPTPRPIDENPSLAKRLMGMRRSKYRNEDGRRIDAGLKAAGLERNALNRQTWLVAEDVVRDNGDRTDFDRAMGTYGHGYPSQQRASFMRDRVWTLVGREVGLHSATARKNASVFKAQRKAALKELRRETRRIFHIVKAAA